MGGSRLLTCLWTGAIAGLLATSACVPMRDSGARPREAVIDTITVDAASVTRTLPTTFFGINVVGFWDPRQRSDGSRRALAQTPIKLVRFPGGAPADWFDWQDPYYKHWSRTGPLDIWRYVLPFGGSLMFQTNYQGHLPDPPGKAYAVNSPRNAAAWVSYDRAHGIAAIMEVGNEEDLLMHHARDLAFDAYIASFNAQARAMHSVNPHVVVIGPAGANEWYWWAYDSLGLFLRATGNRAGTGEADGISLHFYKGTSWADSKGVAQYWRSPNGPWRFIQRTLRAWDTRALPVYVSEWNVGVSSASGGFNQTLGHALVTADMIGAFAESGVAGEEYFDLHGAQGWGMLYGANEGRHVDSATPTYYAMALWGKMGPELLRIVTSVDSASEVSAYATRRRDGSIQVLAINKTARTQALRITFAHLTSRGRILRVYVLEGRKGSVTDVEARYDGVVMPDPTRSLPGPREIALPRGDTVAYVLPPYAAIVLDVAAHG